MISYTCDNCGTIQSSPAGTLPAGWFSLNTIVQKPQATDEAGNPIPPGPPEQFVRHADKQSCYDTIIGAKLA